MAPRPQIVTWELICHTVGMVIVLSLLAAFLASQVTGARMDPAITLAFLGIATFLLGGPSALQWFVRRNGDGPK